MKTNAFLWVTLGLVTLGVSGYFIWRNSQYKTNTQKHKRTFVRA